MLYTPCATVRIFVEYHMFRIRTFGSERKKCMKLNFRNTKSLDHFNVYNIDIRHSIVEWKPTLIYCPYVCNALSSVLLFIFISISHKLNRPRMTISRVRYWYLNILWRQKTRITKHCNINTHFSFDVFMQ